MTREGIVDWFDRAAESFSETTAIECGERRLTYGELRRKADRLARLFLSAGATKGSVVAILVEDRVQVIVGMLASLKAGLAFAPMDSTMPPKRLEGIVSELAPAWSLLACGTGAHVREALNDRHPGSRVVCLDEACERAHGVIHLEDESPGDARLPIEVAPDDMCYVYFTSGSTGRPKGIAGRRKGLDHFIGWEIKTVGAGHGTRVSQLTTPSFDPFLRDVFVPLCAGGTVCVPAERETLLDGRKLLDWIDHRRINLVHCVPSLFRLLLNEQLHPGRLAHLKHVLLAGEALLPSDVRRWTEVYDDRIQLVNLLGPTETTLAKFCYFVRPSDAGRRSIPIGKPIEGASAIVVDAKGNPCPPGMVGEIYIRTPYRSLGYYNRPDLTGEVFIKNPWSNDPEDIVYKTGDMGRVLEDGNFEFLGRKDHQVKIRGFRVELGEIESLLRDHPSIRDVVVVTGEEAGETFLCAYIVRNDDVEPGVLKQYLSEYLPIWMIPAAFIQLEELPHTLSGKVDRRALPAPRRLSEKPDAELVAPRSATEEIVAGIWSKVLRLERLSVLDRFFDLGGHSLIATQILARVREVLEVEMPLKDFFEAPTVAGVAAYVDTAKQVGRTIHVPAIERLPREVKHTQGGERA
ncbi:MAG TPA: non-ribosomal peptide synthetase [Vicinamibacterales bacterium]|nr:non-ribosomal peptide synthetase [Vicinamibacterales bacterium]